MVANTPEDDSLKVQNFLQSERRGINWTEPRIKFLRRSLNSLNSEFNLDSKT